MNKSVFSICFLLSLVSFPQYANATTELLVFVGEKIEVKEFRPDKMITDVAVRAKYRVISTIYGTYDGETIEFEAYDHHDFPPFAQYKNVLLFVSKVDGKYYHEKYQFFPVYTTVSGEWASCGQPYQHESIENYGDIVAHNVEFSPEVTFSTKGMSKADIEMKYSEEYFRIVKGKAICIKGNDPQELFEIKKNGILKARGLF